MARNLRQGAKYLPGVIAQRLGPVIYLVDMNDGVVWRHHVDHIKPLQETSANEILSRGQGEHEDSKDEDTYLPFADTVDSRRSQMQDQSTGHLRRSRRQPTRPVQAPSRSYPSRNCNCSAWYGDVITH